MLINFFFIYRTRKIFYLNIAAANNFNRKTVNCTRSIESVLCVDFTINVSLRIISEDSLHKVVVFTQTLKDSLSVQSDFLDK